MTIDPLSAVAGACAAYATVWLYRRLAHRRRGEPATGERYFVCDGCDDGFESEHDALMHAREEHMAPDDESARHIISEAEV